MTDDYDGGTCSCGSAWFRLEADLDENTPEALCIDQRGLITGYAGKLICVECEAPWVPRQERLRIVG